MHRHMSSKVASLARVLLRSSWPERVAVSLGPTVERSGFGLHRGGGIGRQVREGIFAAGHRLRGGGRPGARPCRLQKGMPFRSHREVPFTRQVVPFARVWLLDSIVPGDKKNLLYFCVQWRKCPICACKAPLLAHWSNTVRLEYFASTGNRLRFRYEPECIFNPGGDIPTVWRLCATSVSNFRSCMHSVRCPCRSSRHLWLCADRCWSWTRGTPLQQQKRPNCSPSWSSGERK